MSSINLPSVSSGMSTDDLANIVAKLIKEIQWLMDGNIDSVNAREIGGWNVGQDSLISTNGNVGLSSKITGGDDVRFWAGGTDPNTASTRIYNSGKITTNNIQITGGTISWSSINSDPDIAAAQGTANGAQAIATAIANGTYSGGTFISGNQIYSPNITGGTITSNTSINVGTDLYVGKQIIMSQGDTSFSTTIQMINGQVYIGSDPAAKALHFTATGGVYAGSQRLDVLTFV